MHPNGPVLEDINVEFPCRHGRAHDPSSFSYSDGSTKQVFGSPKGNGPEQGGKTQKLLVHSQVLALL